MSFTCPICKETLYKQDKSFKCINNHCFDIAKEGYVNLASVKGATSMSGDSKQMCLDRRLFLESGFYERLSDVLSDTIIKYALPQVLTIIDAGCGEGYYSRRIRQQLQSTRQFGVDLSKEAIKLASKAEKGIPQDKQINYAIAGIFDLPFDDNFADAVISVFAPISQKEFARVLKKDGLLIVACPGESHLYGLKKALYNTAKENEEKIPEYEEYDLLEIIRKKYDITVKGNLISALFGMTPYYWKSSQEVQEKAKALTSIDTLCDFIIKVYRKK